MPHEFVKTQDPLPLLDGLPNFAPIARRNGEETSKKAARKLTRSGKRDAQKRLVLEAVRERPGSTSFELAVHIDGMDPPRHMVARRLPDLMADGLVYKCDPKTCSITGNKAIAWAPCVGRGMIQI